MAAGRVRHWKHGWIPVSPEAKAFVAGKGPRPVTEIEQGKLRTALNEQGGFSFDVAHGRQIRVGKTSGYAVQIPGTRVNVGYEDPKTTGNDVTRENFALGVSEVINKHQAALASGDFVLGGWYDPDTNGYTVELSRLFKKNEQAQALEFARKSGQPAVFDMKTGGLHITGAITPHRAESPANLSVLMGPLVEDEALAARYYTGPGFKPLNAHLRFGSQISPQASYYMQNLDSALAKAQVKDDVTTYRGVWGEGWLPEYFPPGSVFSDKGYMSTAAAISGQYEGDTMFVVKIPKGAHALDLEGHGLTHHANERELLLPHNTRMKVNSDVVGDDGKRIINMEVITDGTQINK